MISCNAKVYSEEIDTIEFKAETYAMSMFSIYTHPDEWLQAYNDYLKQNQ